LYFRNFRGENKFNPKDKRATFAIKLDPALADQLDKDGWYVRWTKVKDDAPEDIQPIPYLKVTVNFDVKRPPQVSMIVGKTVTEIDKNTIATLDGANIEHMSIQIRPYVWDDSGKYGASAQLEAMNVYVKENDLQSELRKYMESEDEDEDAPF
jgi:acid phosphatase class B